MRDVLEEATGAANRSRTARTMAIKCITFDLDDTLWDCASVIARAEETFYAWLHRHYPRVARRYEPDSLLEHRQTYYARYPELHHDLTALRKQWLRHLARETGCGPDLVEAGFAVFWRHRNAVRMFDDAHAALETLGARYRIGAITNGNADVHHIGVGHYFDFVVTAAGAGAAKPHPDIFHAALDEAGVAAHEAAHVGDDPRSDVMGAAEVGMRTIWVNPNGRTWPGETGPDAVVRSVGEVLGVLDAWAEHPHPRRG